MSSAQKVIKYFAIALAIFLTVNIIGGIITAFFAIIGITGITGATSEISNNSNNEISFSETYTNITKLKIECKLSNLKIEKGEEFKVEASSITDKFYCKEEKGTLEIKDKTEFRLFYDTVNNSRITIYIPDNNKLENIEIETGAGEVRIEEFFADNLKLKLGAGNVKISNINIDKKTEIDGGVGKVIIEKSILNNLDLDCGVGEFEMTAKLLGNSDIDCGVGRLSINLVGNENDYEILAKKGLGSFTINSKEVQDNTKYGNGENYITIDAGVGSTNIKYE